MNLRNLFIWFSLVWLVGCQTAETNNQKPGVAVTLPPQEYFTAYLARDICQVHVMVPPGSSHESYEPKPSDIQRLEHSIAYFRMGPIGFELAWMNRLQSMYPEMKVFDLSEGIQLEGHHDHAPHHEHGHNGCSDPHYWMSPRASLIMSYNIKRALVELFPAHSDSIEARYIRLSEDISRLDEEISRILAPIDHKTFAIFHPVLGYFAADYGLTQIAMEEDGKEPTPSRLRTIIQTMKEDQVPLIFIQREFNTDHARLVAESSGARIVVIDPLRLDWKDGLLEIAHELARNQP